MDFKIKDGEQYRLKTCEVASATVIEAGDLVALDSGLIVKAEANDIAVAYCPKGSADGEESCEVTVGNDFTLTGEADANFAKTNRGSTCDIVLNNGTIQIDLGASSTNVLRVGIGEDAGVVGSDEDIEVRIEKPLF